MPIFQQPIVIDTNILLDCFVFNDATTIQLKHLLINHQLNWLATPGMEEEYQRVLNYPSVLRWFAKSQNEHMNEQLTRIFSQYAQYVGEAPQYKNYLCRDQDDQKFINLALEHKTILLSKDKAILKMASKLKAKDVMVTAKFAFTKTPCLG